MIFHYLTAIEANTFKKKIKISLCGREKIEFGSWLSAIFNFSARFWFVDSRITPSLHSFYHTIKMFWKWFPNILQLFEANNFQKKVQNLNFSAVQKSEILNFFSNIFVSNGCKRMGNCFRDMLMLWKILSRL